MEYDVYFFSPTGTCRATAEGLVEAVPGGRLVDLTLPALRATAPMPDKGKLFTLIFPVYAQRIPDLLRDWLYNLPKQGGAACLIACYGSVTLGNALPGAARLAAEATGRTVVAGAELPGAHAFDCARTHRDLHAEPAWRLEELADFFRAALQKAEAGGEGVDFTCRPAVGALLPQDFLCKLGSPYPAIDEGKCTRCGACERVCPTGAAAGQRARCVRCTACIRACPVGARRLTFRTGIPGAFLEHGIKQKKEPRYYV